MKTALITGINGQDGSYLSELLVEKGYEVHGLIRYSTMSQEATKIKNAKLHYGDMTDSAVLRHIITKSQPDEIYNLAAQSQVRVSFDEPVYTANVNAMGVISLLEAIKDTNPKIKFYQASTSEMFGKVKETPQTENTPFYPRSPYGCSKVYSYWQTINYRESYNIFACNGILFNHESPRRGETFVTRKITQAATRIKEGLQSELVLGNRTAKRDWGFAGDYVKAMWLMLQHEIPDDYVIATGETHSIQECVDIVFEYLNLDWRDFVKEDQKFLRPAEVDTLIGDASKAKNILGWTPTVNFKELILMMTNADWELAKKEKYNLLYK